MRGDVQRKVSDEQFLDLWKEHASVEKVAFAAGITVRQAHHRRRSIEKKLDQPLVAKDRRGAVYQNVYAPKGYKHHNLGIENGTVIVGSDAHYWPGIRTTAHAAFVHLIRELTPNVIVMNGDAFDGASISRHPTIDWTHRPSVVEELRAVELALQEIEAHSNGAKLIWPLGNHDSRFESRLAQQAPEYAGVRGFSLKDHFPAWTPCWSVWLNDSVVVKHRWHNGLHATHNNTLKAGTNIVTGHLHSLKVTPWSDYVGVRFGVDTGTLAELTGPQFSYIEESPVNWRSGFVVLTIHKGRLLWPEICHVVAPGRVEFRGQILEVA